VARAEPGNGADLRLQHQRAERADAGDGRQLRGGGVPARLALDQPIERVNLVGVEAAVAASTRAWIREVLRLV
jgi:hypothetical protein